MEFLVTQIDEILYNGELMGYQCFDGTGQSVKVKKGRGGYLKAKWDDLQVGRAYTFTMGEYDGKPFVKDFESMSEAMAEKIPAVVKEAVNMGAEVESVSPKYKADPAKTTSIENQVALKCATEIAVSKIDKGEEMSTDKVISVAKQFRQFLQGA